MRTVFVAVVTLASIALAAPSLEEQAKALFKPLPKAFESKDNPITKEKVALGRQLFFETRLSKNHDVSCNSCHDLAKYGVDGEATSTGHKKQKGGRNAPTVYNAGDHIAQFWDGRAATLEDQAKGPVLNPVEMAMPDDAAVDGGHQVHPRLRAAVQEGLPRRREARSPTTTSRRPSAPSSARW